MRRAAVGGFTLVELLVVVAIIGILVMLLLPAIQAAREAGRRTQCSNNLRNIALAAMNHADTVHSLPSGGWGYGWIGDPDMPLGRSQPGGWAFAVLPYLEQQQVFNMTSKLPDATKRAAGAMMVQMTVGVFNCPTRRYGVFPNNCSFVNINKPDKVARSDYAGNGGDTATSGQQYGPSSLAGAATYSWATITENGTIFQRSAIVPERIPDGSSNTYMLGEKYLSPDNYFNGSDSADDQCVYMGYDRDVIRWGNLPPKRDRRGLADWTYFGSAHADVCNFAMCDASIHSVSYEIDPQTHKYLCNREDKHAVDIGKGTN